MRSYGNALVNFTFFCTSKDFCLWFPYEIHFFIQPFVPGCAFYFSCSLLYTQSYYVVIRKCRLIYFSQFPVDVVTLWGRQKRSFQSTYSTVQLDSRVGLPIAIKHVTQQHQMHELRIATIYIEPYHLHY